LQGIDEDFCNSFEVATRNPKTNDEATEKKLKRRVKLKIRSIIIKFNGTVRFSPKNPDQTKYV